MRGGDTKWCCACQLMQLGRGTHAASMAVLTWNIQVQKPVNAWDRYASGSGRWPGHPNDERNQASLQRPLLLGQIVATVHAPGLCCAWQFQHLLPGSWAGPALPCCGRLWPDTENCILPHWHCRPKQDCCRLVTVQVKGPVPASAWHTASELQSEAFKRIRQCNFGPKFFGMSDCRGSGSPGVADCCHRYPSCCPASQCPFRAYRWTSCARTPCLGRTVARAAGST